MTDAEILTAVKKRLNITGNFQDNTITGYIDDVKAFMISAGVKQSVVESAASIGCIARGVSDLYNFGSGNVRFSEFFTQRVIQLKKEGEPNENTN